MNHTLFQALAVIAPLVVAIVFHEVAHGWAALALGDPTAQERRRLSLNPLRHVDLFGTIILPGFLRLVGAPVFGWAKPVPVNKWRLRNPRFGMMAVAAAGPGSNLAMAAVGAVLLGLLVGSYADAQSAPFLIEFLAANLLNFIVINVFLALFNLLPIPPFDGSHIVEGILPRPLARAYSRLGMVGLPLVLLLLIVLPMVVPGYDIIARVVLPPVQWLIGHFLALTQAVAGESGAGWLT
jgi:Zn-dependent protease